MPTWPGIPSDGRYNRSGFDQRGVPATPGDCLASVSEPPYYIREHQCPRKAVDGGLCRQHAKQRDRWLKIQEGG